MKNKIEKRLEYLRNEIIKECISYEEIAELQSLSKYIKPNDILLLEWAGVSEKLLKLEIIKTTDDTFIVIDGNAKVYCLDLPDVLDEIKERLSN